jgi:hypothetical protein
MCGYLLYTDEDVSIEDLPADAHRCPDCALRSCQPIAS